MLLRCWSKDVLYILLASAEIASNTFVARNHETARWGDLCTAGNHSSEQGAPALAANDMERKREGACAVAERLGCACLGRGEHLATRLEDVKGLGEERRHGSAGRTRHERGENGRKRRENGFRRVEVRLCKLESGPVETLSSSVCDSYLVWFSQGALTREGNVAPQSRAESAPEHRHALFADERNHLLCRRRVRRRRAAG